MTLYNQLMHSGNPQAAVQMVISNQPGGGIMGKCTVIFQVSPLIVESNHQCQ